MRNMPSGYSELRNRNLVLHLLNIVCLIITCIACAIDIQILHEEEAMKKQQSSFHYSAPVTEYPSPTFTIPTTNPYATPQEAALQCTSLGGIPTYSVKANNRLATLTCTSKQNPNESFSFPLETPPIAPKSVKNVGNMNLPTYKDTQKACFELGGALITNKNQSVCSNKNGSTLFTSEDAPTPKPFTVKRVK
jgi:hypothetical protein